MNLEYIFKIIDKDDWQKAKQLGTLEGSDADKKDGFIQEKLKKYNIDISEKKIDIILTFITYHTFLQSYYRSF